MNNNLYLSFIVVARNDNYGGFFLHRVNVFTKVLLTLCDKYKLNSELIIVEWNPSEGKPRLKDALDWPKNSGHCQIRIIEVSWTIHRKLTNSQHIPVFEYIGKNAGIRHARGKYVLATNPDNIFSEELIRFLAIRKLSKNSFYRIARHDIKSPAPLETTKKILEYCSRNIIGVHNYWGSFKSEIGFIFNLCRILKAFLEHLKLKLFYFPFTLPFTSASGDFFLMHRDNWNILRGYPEFKTHSQIDSYMCNISLTYGLKQRILYGKGIRLYHQDHARTECSHRPLTNIGEYYKDCKKMIKKRGPLIFNDENWGLRKENLPEYYVNLFLDR